MGTALKLIRISFAMAICLSGAYTSNASAKTFAIPKLGKFVGKKQKEKLRQLLGAYESANYIESDCIAPKHCEMFPGVDPIAGILVLYDKHDRILRIDIDFKEPINKQVLEEQFGPFKKTSLGQSECDKSESGSMKLYLTKNAEFFYFYSKPSHLGFSLVEARAIMTISFEARPKFERMPKCK